MAKIDKNLYTKAEFRKIQAAKIKAKQEKNITIEAPTPIHGKNDIYNFLCLKHGKKYDERYVNILYNMVRRNFPYKFNFFCLTENSHGIVSDVQIIDLPRHLHLNGWWYKPYIFSQELPIEGTILYLDLDVVITNSIDKLFSYQEGEFCIIRDFTRIMRPNWHKFNSSVMRFQKGALDFVWQTFTKDYKTIMRKHFGDQDYIFEVCQSTAKFWPDNWIRSWKWEIRKSKQFRLGGRRGDRKFDKIENVQAPPDCCIAVFHGDPNPHNCEDPYIMEKWK